MKTAIIYTVVLLLISCASSSAPWPRTEYTGRPLPLNPFYDIRQDEEDSNIFFAVAPRSDSLLLNLYDAKGSLALTLFQGRSSDPISDDQLQIVLVDLGEHCRKNRYDLNQSSYKMVLFGQSGRAEFHIRISGVAP